MILLRNRIYTYVWERFKKLAHVIVGLSSLKSAG